MIEACISAMINAGIAIENKRFCEIAMNELVRLSPVAHPTPHPRNHTRALSEARLALGSSRVMHTSESVASVAIDLSAARNYDRSTPNAAIQSHELSSSSAHGLRSDTTLVPNIFKSNRAKRGLTQITKLLDFLSGSKSIAIDGEYWHRTALRNAEFS
jgi:hypothetical protein